MCLVLAGCGSSKDGADAGAAADSGVAGRTHEDGGRGGAGSGGSRASGGGKGGAVAAANGGGGGERGGDEHPTPSGMIRIVPNIVAGSQIGTPGGSGVGVKSEALRIGTPSATTLYSLKYYIISIQLCQDLEASGSGYSNARGCIDLYNNQKPDSPDYNTYTVSAAQADTTEGHFIDLMSSAGQSALRKPVTVQLPSPVDVDHASDDADAGVAIDDAPSGAFRYGLINFYRPVKVRAEFPIIGETDTMFRTKAVTMIHDIPGFNGGLGGERVDIGDTLMAPTEETVYMLNNGGVWFTFQKPFVITQEDVDAKAEIKLDLVFNPENFGQAYSADCANDQRVVVCDPKNGVSIDMPYVHMSPVPRKAGEKTRKEIYMLDYDDDSQVRIELYYNDHDPEAGVQGVDLALVYGSNTASANMSSLNTIASNFVAQKGSISGGDASVSLLDYQREVNLEGLRRRQAGTATIHCRFTGSICPSVGMDLQRAYTFVDDVVVSSD
jgi:hypothetical protein